LRPKVRTNAVALLGPMTHPQARETLQLLITDPNPEVASRAMRGAGRQKNEQVVSTLGALLHSAEVTPLMAAEAAKALIAIDSPAARAHVDAYVAASPNDLPHRGSAVVEGILNARHRS